MAIPKNQSFIWIENAFLLPCKQLTKVEISYQIITSLTYKYKALNQDLDFYQNSNNKKHIVTNGMLVNKVQNCSKMTNYCVFQQYNN